MKLGREGVWETRLTPAQCAAKLLSATEEDRFVHRRTMDPPGTLYRSGAFPFCCVRAPISPLDWALFETRLQARFVGTESGTRIVGRFELSVAGMAVLLVWMLLVVPAGAIAALILVAQWIRSGTVASFGGLLGVLLPWLGVAMLACDWRRSAPQRRRLEEFVVTAFEARLGKESDARP